MNKFMKEIRENRLLVEVPLGIYRPEVITASVYKFTDKCYISQDVGDNECISVIFEAKAGITVDYQLTAKEFSNELIDQQVRFAVNQKFGSIRDAIVKKAFSPIS